MTTIKFDLSCLKEDFQNFIFKKIGCENYYDFIHNYKNNFEITISKLDKQISPLNYLNEEESTNCLFKNFDPKSLNMIENSENLDEKEKKDDQEETKSSSNLSEDLEEEKIETEVNPKYFVENNNIFLNINKKIINKKMTKLFKKNGGSWIKSKNIWLFPLSAKNFIENSLTSLNSESFIKNITHENNKVIVIPKLNHPKYGTPIIYDKTGNIGIWECSTKGWIFSKKSN